MEISKYIVIAAFIAFSTGRPEHTPPKCRFLPLKTTQRRIGTCCLLPGKHDRVFREDVVVQEPERPPDEDVPSTMPPGPTCDVHAFFFRDKFIGKCCSFVGGAFFRLRSILKPHFKQEESNSTSVTGNYNETTTEEVVTTTETAASESEVPDISVRLFINSSCREGYVLDSNYNCVEEF